MRGIRSPPAASGVRYGRENGARRRDRANDGEWLDRQGAGETDDHGLGSLDNLVVEGRESGCV